MTKNFFAFAFIAILLSACCGTKNARDNKNSTTAVSVPYTTAKNYFVRNDYKEAPLHFLKITSLTDFENVFGRAPLEMNGGNPTDIDFSKNYVIAIIDETNDKSGELSVKSLSQKNETITVSYQIADGHKMSFSKRYLAILIVDKKYQGAIQLEKTK